MHKEWEDYDRKQFLAWWAANSASQIKEIACNAPVQPGRECCKLLLDEKDMKVKICRMKPSHAKPTTVLNIRLSVCAAEINTFSFLSGLLFARVFLIYLLSVTECNYPPSLLSSLSAYLFSGLPFAQYCRLHCWWGAEQEVKLFKKTGDKEMHAICWNLLHKKECCLSPT